VQEPDPERREQEEARGEQDTATRQARGGEERDGREEDEAGAVHTRQRSGAG
jgi:hypothetical protein